MKKLTVILAIICCLFFSTAAFAAMILEYDGGVHNYTGSVYSLSVNGRELKNLPLEPIIFNDRALVPVREVFEALGATVTYKDDTKAITISYDGKAVKIKIGSAIAEIDGKSVNIPDNITPKLIAKWGESAKTMVPVRFVSDSVGLKVDFDGNLGKISVSENVKMTDTKQNKITGISAKEEEDVVTVTVTASGNIPKMSAPSVTAGGTLFVDVDDMGYTTTNKKEINLGAVSMVRLGLHDNSTRIAVDTKDMKKYKVALAGNSIIFKISKDEGAEVDATDEEEKASDKPDEKDNSPKPSELSGGTIYVVLDAGHGGADPGAVGNLMTDDELKAYHEALQAEEPNLEGLEVGTGKTYYEKTIALAVTQKVQEKLTENGVSVIMTRSGDTYPKLDERPEIANKKGAAMFLSIHLNSTVMPVASASGMEIYYSESNNGKDYGITSKEMASIIVKKAAKSAGALNRGVKSGNLLVTRKSVMPANLIEIGFMNNPDELAKLITDEYQEKIAEGIAEGILEVLGKIKLP